MSDFLADGVELFAGVCVRDYAQARPWYEALLGGPPSFLAHETEAVWELAPHRWLVVEQRPERAGFAAQTVFVDDLDARVAGIAARGIEPAEEETYGGGVRKVIYRDADGNEVGFGGNPEADLAADD
ncbi:VOC family protein [Nocardioides carbamazepini]|uniref:VOC family protein n=1 Tax=Nocardioides carbamazepini TaxID=2854259 RepID=UPI00214A0660|nr:VOC family protein [Nocardioides carbamazepini]MCR1783154.1 VOC family protein [Nocardioides carbamazepini]